MSLFVLVSGVCVEIYLLNADILCGPSMNQYMINMHMEEDNDYVPKKKKKAFRTMHDLIRICLPNPPPLPYTHTKYHILICLIIG